MCLAVELVLGSFALAMAPVLSQKIPTGSVQLGNMPSSITNFFSHNSSFDASKAAIYSDSVVDWATTECLPPLQLIAPPFNMKTYPVWDFESSRSELRLASA